MEFFNKLPKAAWIAGAVIVAVGVGAVGAYAASAHNKRLMEAAVNVDTIYEGIKIDQVDVAGKTQSEAYEYLLSALNDKTTQQKLTLTYEGETWEIPFSAIHAKYDIQDAVVTAWETGRSGDLKERYETVMALKNNGLNIDAGYTFDEEKLTEKLKEVAEELDQEAQDSSLKRVNGQFVIGESAPGHVMNLEKTKTAAEAVVMAKTSGTITPVVDVVEPKVKEEDNAQVKDLIGTFYTTYSANAAARNENLRVGSANISDTVIAPGDIFSMNVGLGPQTYENGYKDAGVYVNGKVEQGVGGGVCQITTTLYNAAILAELEIVERFPHSMTVGYVPLGRDSAVAGTYKDLKFRNNTDAPIYIEAYAKDGKQVCNIYGKEVHQPGRVVEFETEYETTIPKPAEKVTEDPNMLEGERKVTANGKTGCKVSVYKKVTQNGALVSREWFSSSSYIATPDEVTVGTGKPVEEPPEVTPEEPIQETEGSTGDGASSVFEEQPAPEPTDV